MRRFSAGYLAHTRRGMWEERDALADLDLGGRRRVLDVGCGTGALTRILREASGATVVGLDADPSLLAHVESPSLAGDAARLPVADGGFDLVACQALLVNLVEPRDVVRELARVSSDLVAAVEPDNAAVHVDSTVAAETRLERRARAAYIEGVRTDAAMGADAAGVFEAAGLTDVRTTRYDHRQDIGPPYSADDVEGAARKARGTRLDEQRATLLDGGLTPAEFDELRDGWRAMGRAVVEQMREGEYERAESVPFYVTVGRA